MAVKTKCPICGIELEEKAFKLIRELWRFSFYLVGMYECPNCKGVFNHYEGTSPRGRRSSFAIRVGPRGRG